MRRRALAALAAVTIGVLPAQQPAPKPETVMITFHVKEGVEAELARAIEKHWKGFHVPVLVERRELTSRDRYRN
jgi:hypothetical protein